MLKLLKKLFINGDWNIGFRKKNNIKYNCNSFVEGNYNSLQKISNYWFADPIGFKTNSKNYLFCEAFNKKEQKGEIGVFEIIDGKCQNFRIIISEGYHMSYPCVFEKDGNYYMIPETGENLTLNLYKSIDFPYKWEKEVVLASGKNYADPTIFIVDCKIFLMVYEESVGNYICRLFNLDIDKKMIVEIATKHYKKNIGRPAGIPLLFNNKIIRPAQECTNTYGRSIIWKEVKIDNDYFEEKDIFTIDNSKVIIDGQRKPSRIHTYTSTSDYEFIDYNIDVFDLLKRYKILKRKKAVNKRRSSNNMKSMH